MPSLFSPLRVGELTLPNRVIMAPLTRCRSGIAITILLEAQLNKSSRG